LIPNRNLDNDTTAGYYSLAIEAPDELYLAIEFVEGISFGAGINEVNLLFANDYLEGQYDTQGWTRLYDDDENGTYGRVVYLQPGETNERTFANPAYRQVLKNGVLWAALEPAVVNAPPTAVDDGYSMLQDTVLTVPAASGLLSNDSDDGGVLQASLQSAPAHGVANVALDGSFVYTPTVAFTGTDSFVYQVSDGALTDTAVAVIQVISAAEEPLYLPLLVLP
ncbi:MAG: cadherin-like domain-containing protein, partial [Anaerolineales bacterium]|nr:cadherin-like domain-containing protein [Anaerolineales bacterium]